MRVRPITPSALVEELADRAEGRVAIDGAAAAGPEALAEALVAPLRLRGHPAVHVCTSDFLRPASVRLELGRTNPDSFYEGWVDEAALRREVLDPAGPGGTRRIITRFWDPARDRATREPYSDLSDKAVVLVSGPLLLGAGLPFDLSVHLSLSEGALERRTPEAERWTLPAFARYDAEVAPASFADVVVRMDHPARPAVVENRF